MHVCRSINFPTTIASLLVVIAISRGARAQSVEYFITPWVVAPLGSQAGATAVSTPPSGTQAPSPYSNLYNRVVAQSSITAPPIIFSTNIGIDEIATDNVAAAHDGRQPDLGSLFSLGETISADSVRLKGVLSVTGFYRRNVIDTDLDEASAFGYARSRAIIVPGHIFFDLNGLIDDLERTGAGIQNPVLQSPQNTHQYNISASPFAVAAIDGFGRVMLRYEIGQVWFNNNTAPDPLFGLAPITSSMNQAVHGDFSMPGTVVPRLMSDVSVNGSENESGNPISGNLRRASGESINEYEVARFASIITGGGYEYLRDPDVPLVNGQGAIWDFGGRIRPNADSSILVTYGRHDRKSDFAGEIAWRITPLTSIYAKYSDSLTTAQEELIGNNADSILGSTGAVADVTYNQSTLIGVLDEAALAAGPGGEQDIAGLGVPLGTLDSLSPLQNGLFRTKSLSGTATSLIGGDAVSLTGFYQQNVSFTPILAPSSTVEGATATWSRGFTERLSGEASAGYRHMIGVGQGDIYNASLGATYTLSDTLAVSARYDFIWRANAPGNTGYIQNALTVGVHKSFD